MLLYKAKNLRDPDVQDFARVRPTLSDPQRRWLANALAIVHPGHRWLPSLLEGLSEMV